MSEYIVKQIENIGKKGSSLRGPAWGRSNPDLGASNSLDSPSFTQNWIATLAQGGLLAKTKQNSNKSSVLNHV
jgi:hypothetical protein